MKSVRVGLMNTPVIIVAVTQTLSETGTGAPIYSETAIDTVFGEYEELASSEALVSSKPTAFLAATLKIWPYPGLTAKHRLRINGYTFDIVSINDTDERRRKLLRLRANL